MFALNFNKIFTKFIRHAANLRSNTRANVAIITALAMLPMIGAVGCVIDYTDASMIKTKLQAAADAAALATVSVNSSAVTAAQAMTGNGPVTAGSTFATNFFSANLGGTSGYTGLNPSATVTKTNGNIITATVSFTANVPTTFMGALGFSQMSISGTSTASYEYAIYIDFYMMLDVSGSMGMPSTSSEESRLMAVNPDNYGNYTSGCQFACHFSGSGSCSTNSKTQKTTGNCACPDYGYNTSNKYVQLQRYVTGNLCEGYSVSRTGTTTSTPYTNLNQSPATSCPTAGTTSCIQLRLDAVGYAVSQMLTTAYNKEQQDNISGQFRVGLYPFIVDLYSYFPLTTSINTTGSGTINNAAQQLATQLDTGQNTSLGSGGTHFDNAFSDLNGLITSVGTGASSTSTLPYVFLVTDGSQDNQTYTYSPQGGSWAGSNHATTISAADCATLKSRGVTIAVLYIPYTKISPVNAAFANDEDDAANNNIPNIPAPLTSCASSPDFFFTANTPTDITNALQAMFNKAITTAHITN